MIPLVKDTINSRDIDSLIEWLQTYPRLTKDKLTLEYEAAWSKFLDCKYSVFVNSGSSAILIMLYSLLEKKTIRIGDSIIVPAVSWATNLSPIIQLGLKPILCDCNLKDLSIDIDHFQDLIKKHDPSVLLLVSVLGLVPNMDDIVNICNKNNLILLEDTCESLGSKFNDKHLGTFGYMSVFSTYFGHHISTIEGGMVCTNSKDMFNILVSLRSHGWDRDMDDDYKQQIKKENKTLNTFEDLYKFYYTGFNFRSTDLQAFIGIKQLERLPNIIKKRNNNYNIYKKYINNSFWTAPQSTSKMYISNFAFPIMSKNRNEIVQRLINNKIETRPLICGSLGRQPFWINRFGQQRLKNADIVNDFGLYIPNNDQITKDEIYTIIKAVNND